MIKVISFDLWDTVFVDDSDEPKREKAGRLSKREERRELVWQFANKHKKISRELVDALYDTSDAAFRKVWHEQFVTWKVRSRLEIIFHGLGIELPEEEMNELTRLHEEMEIEFCPDLVPGVGDAIRRLHEKYKLAVVSDAIFTPGRLLRKILEKKGLVHYFDHFVFSDEIGKAKPHPKVFESVWNYFHIQPEELVHIGDREHNDIIGPKNLGTHALLCTVSINRGSEHTRADGVFSDYKDLFSIVESLNK
jgi:putative hydrolase of the HAD superfamily